MSFFLINEQIKHIQSTLFNVYPQNKSYRKLFYIQNSLGESTRILPRNFKEILNKIVLTIWFIDDSGRANEIQNGVFLQ